MAKKRYYEGKYGSADSRRAMEDADAGMLSGTGIANMPQQVIYKEWAASPSLTPINAPEGLNDGKSGIDKQVNQDNEKKKGPEANPF